MKGALALSGRRLFVGSYDHHLYALDARNGTADLARLVAGPPRRARHVLLDAGRRVRTRLHRLDRRQGLLVRRDERRAALVAVDRRLRLRLAGGLERAASWSARTAARFFALDAATGDIQWKFEANGPISGSATVLGDVVYFSTLKGRTYGLDAATGQAALELPGRQVLAGRRRARPRYLTGYTRLYGLVRR